MRKMVLDALFSKTKQGILQACLLQPDKWWYLSDLARHLKVSPSALQRDLAAFTKVGLLVMRRDGNRVYYQMNVQCPGIFDLQKFIEKSGGLLEVVEKAFKKFLPEIEFLFIFGSVASDEYEPTSDIDVMAIGRASQFELTTPLNKAEEMLDRQVNAVVFSQKELRERWKGRDAFLLTVMKNKKIFLKGTEDGLRALVEE